MVRWLGRVKGAAARVNGELGLLDGELAQTDRRRRQTGWPPGEVDDQFPVDVFQTGSGTSSNMNANEVIASLAGEGAHPNDHVNMGQSSNDVFPSAPCTSPRWTRPPTACCPRWRPWSAHFATKADAFADVVKSGRTHLMDAVPVTLGQEFAGLRGAGTPGRQAGAATRCPRWRRSRWAARRRAPG